MDGFGQIKFTFEGDLYIEAQTLMAFSRHIGRAVDPLLHFHTSYLGGFLVLR